MGYALYYFVRKNLSVAMPVMEQELGLSKSQLGLFLTMHGLLYGVSKFLNGFVGDRVNACWMMAAGLAMCGLLNLAFGWSSTAWSLGLTGFFGYLSTVLSGVGVGWLVERHGWDAGFLMFIAAAVAGMLLFMLCWPARADAYERY